MSQTSRTAIDQYYAEILKPGTDYFAVDIGLIQVHKLPDVALFLPDANAKGGFKVFRKKGLYLSSVEIDNLISNKVPALFIQKQDVPVFTQYIEKLVEEQPAQSGLADDKKILELRSGAIQVMSDIFENPSKENIEKGVKVVSKFVYLIMKDPKAFNILASLSSHDPYTLQHSVGVATNSIILAKKMGINDEISLIEVGTGGLLHDIGKTKVPKEIINKRGPLDEAEWAVMKQHSTFGYEILKDNADIGTRAKLAVLQHHEDSHGGGYPVGLSGEQVSFFAKIVAISDIYNAITTDRTYSKAKPPFEAFQLIKDKLIHKVDGALFEALVKIYGGKLP
jgi:putative nucleotidyltransferase with HDIG domain